MPDAHEWDVLSRLRRSADAASYRMSPGEKMIREKLIEPIDVTFEIAHWVKRWKR